MAIAFDASVNGGSGGSSVSPLTWSHITSGSNRVLYVGVSADPTIDNILGVTYNSVSMILVNKTRRGGNSRYSYLFYLVNPASGANTVSVSMLSGAVDAAGSSSFSGVNQSLIYTGGSPTDNQNSTNGTGTSGTASVSTVSDNSWLVGFYVDGGGGGGASAGSNTFMRQQCAGSSVWMVDTNGPDSPAGSFSLTVATNNGSQAWALNIASLSPAATVSTKLLALLGVG